MLDRRVLFGAIVGVLLLAGCPATLPTASAPPPRGKPYREYLDEGRGPASRPANTVEADAMTVHFIDVGQGTAILLEFPCGAVLIDTGGELNEAFDSRASLFEYLDAFFEGRPELRRTFAGLVITHPHLDHTRWVMEVLARYDVENVLDDGLVSDEPGGEEQARMREWLADRPSIGHVEVLASTIPPGGLTGPVVDPVGACEASAVDPQIRALWGRVTEDLDTYGDRPNNHSIVLRVDFGEASALLVADLEQLGAARMLEKFKAEPALFDVDLYQVGHHGSRNGTSVPLLKAMTPELAVIPAGPYDRNLDWTARRYGHPHSLVLELLDAHVTGTRRPVEVQAGVRGAWKGKKEQFKPVRVTKAVYATGWDGSIRVRAYANGWMQVETSVEAAPR